MALLEKWDRASRENEVISDKELGNMLRMRGCLASQEYEESDKDR